MKKNQTLVVVVSTTGIVLLLLSAPIVGFYIRGRMAVSRDAASLASEVKAAYDAKKSSFLTYTKDEDNILSANLVAEKIGKTEMSVCYVKNSGGAEFSPGGDLQSCYLRITVGYYTELSKAAVLNGLLASSPSAGTYDDYMLKNDPATCKLTDGASGVTVRYVEKGSTPSTMGEYDYLNYEECGRPAAASGLGSAELRTIGPNLSIKSIETLGNNAVDDSRSQVWLEVDYTYFNQSIACGSDLMARFSCDTATWQPIQ